MKKILTFFFVSLILVLHGYGKQIDEKTAKTVGQNFILNHVGSNTLNNSPVLELTYQATSDAGFSPVESVTYFYVFAFNAGQGFIIVSGDDKSAPILGYSADRTFDTSKIPPHVAAWLEWYKKEIRYAIENDLRAADEVEASWSELLTGSHETLKNTSVVAPLLQTQWDQSPNYNALCPYDNQYQEYTVTGCVATAMAQVMKYWNAPATGAGFHSYNSNNYGTLSADFGSTTYAWESMPASLSGPNTAVATLMYHCGVSVDMSYGVGQTGGSSAYVVSSQSPTQNCSEYAFKTYFGYKPTEIGQMRDDFSLDAWITKLKTELDASRPVLYAGIGDGGGHCFVCDGYDASNYFHFNWGWSGQYDGYFQIDALNPTGVGTGGGTGGFNSYQQAIFGLEPEAGGGGGGSGGTTYDLRLYSQVAASQTSILYGATFNITASVVNYDTNNFQGDFCAAIFDSENVYIDMVDISMNQSVQSGYFENLTFTTTGLLTMTPGTYSIGVYYRPTGGNWYLVQNGDYSNYVQVTVTNANTIELYAPMTITPGNILMQGQPVGVHLDVVNNGSTTFTGTFDVSLYDLDGYAVFTVAEITNASLQAGYHYTNGLDFNNNNLDLSPGTYLIAIQYKPDGGNWELTGSTNYQNPIRVLVQQEVLTPDIYEPNNTIAQAYNLPVNFNGSEAIITTPNSNCNTGNDYDLYKIELPQGYSYAVGARLFDANFGNNGTIYTLDAIFMYSIDGVKGSDVYDDMIPGNVPLANGGTVWFQVSPKYTGQTGTYLLSINIGKYPQGISDANAEESIRVFPNPAMDILTIDLSGYPAKINQIRLVNVQGETVLSKNIAQKQDNIRIDLRELSGGLYMLNLLLDSGMISKKIVIRK